jgi:UDP-N-acetylmuramoyl-L-alanyl-D-glutamate--2,6-diaminopimelate ligase
VDVEPAGEAQVDARGAEDAGKRRERDLFLVADRPAAIEAAFERARPGDIVLLAGKGHEPSIIGPDGPVAYDERATAEAALARLGFAAAAPDRGR